MCVCVCVCVCMCVFVAYFFVSCYYSGPYWLQGKCLHAVITADNTGHSIIPAMLHVGL